MKARIAGYWQLWSILVAQAVLTLPWLWRTAPYSDEALYLNAGHQEWAHVLHHVSLLPYATTFSGAPVLYPPIAAAADSVGGLPAARLLSLLFMLASTALVFLIGDRLFGRMTGILGSLLFAVCGLVVHFGALATLDPVALFLLVLAMWAAVRIRDGGAGWLVLCPAALVAANATRYATLGWDPVVFGAIILRGWSENRARAVGMAVSVAVTSGVLDAGLLMLGGADYAKGLVATVFWFIHPDAQGSASSVLLHALAMTGLTVILAIGGVVISRVRRMPASATVFLSLLVLAALLVPIDQVSIRQVSSLDKNLVFGLPFATLGAGYALSGARTWLGWQRSWGKVAATTAAVLLVIAVLVTGRLETVQFRGTGVDAAYRVATTIKQNYRSGTFILVDGSYRTDQYYLPAIPRDSWITSLPAAPGQRVRMWAQICSGDVSVVVLRLTGRSYDNPSDHDIAGLLHLMYSQMTVPGGGGHKTQVWVLDHKRAGGCLAG